jgi:hypothetical protein
VTSLHLSLAAALGQATSLHSAAHLTSSTPGTRTPPLSLAGAWLLLAGDYGSMGQVALAADVAARAAVALGHARGAPHAHRETRARGGGGGEGSSEATGGQPGADSEPLPGGTRAAAAVCKPHQHRGRLTAASRALPWLVATWARGACAATEGTWRWRKGERGPEVLRRLLEGAGIAAGGGGVLVAVAECCAGAVTEAAARNVSG